MKTPKFATHYENRIKSTLDCSVEPSRTLQSDADSADINNILKRYERTGLLPEMIKVDPRYGDFSEVPTYQEALEIVSRSHEQFTNLDAHIRARFSNDPAEFLAFATNPDNMKEMVKLGLAIEKQPEITPVVTPAQPEVKNA